MVATWMFALRNQRRAAVKHTRRRRGRRTRGLQPEHGPGRFGHFVCDVLLGLFFILELRNGLNCGWICKAVFEERWSGS
jgi:hypothetical protein